MRSRNLALVAMLVAATTLVTGCGNDPDIVGAGHPAPRELPASAELPDIAGAAFTDLTGSDTAEVTAVDNRFRDQFITVSAGTEITFENKGRTQHDVLPSIDGDFDPIEPDELQPGDVGSITLAEPGDYPYYCSLHGTTAKGMVGVIRVVDDAV